MHDGTYRLLPGQIRGFGLRRQTLLLARDGPLRLTYRDAALDWLPGVVTPTTILLDEGAAYRMPCDAWVDIRTGAGTGMGGGASGRASGEAGAVTLGIASAAMPALPRRMLAWAARAMRRHRAVTRNAGR
ncbi:hypothetical protein OVY01_21325 [Robbsia sp. Bb-Pol-6]|uniref:DUF2917 domain-containing protein n=1 Tax=Robbsia betulipollinis TaxID=2981849 RepID=A0ABT3ZSZ3_9BURK|nr:hypothetical protein [Robbsia betulipollinis]MCY0389689.1 hypothetical protein [Robbsia betulipollinis]